jgi:hypothetical protein
MRCVDNRNHAEEHSGHGERLARLAAFLCRTQCMAKQTHTGRREDEANREQPQGRGRARMEFMGKLHLSCPENRWLYRLGRCWFYIDAISVAAGRRDVARWLARAAIQ